MIFALRKSNRSLLQTKGNDIRIGQYFFGLRGTINKRTQRSQSKGMVIIHVGKSNKIAQEITGVMINPAKCFKSQ